MKLPCTHYGIPCDAGTEGDCTCRKRFFKIVTRLDATALEARGWKLDASPGAALGSELKEKPNGTD